MAADRPRFHSDAALELDEAAAWYARQSESLADRFLRAVEEASERLVLYPEAYQRVEVPCYDGDPPRRVGVHDFPYALIYARLQDRILLIVAIAHDKRKPAYWADRLVLPE